MSGGFSFSSKPPNMTSSSSPFPQSFASSPFPPSFASSSSSPFSLPTNPNPTSRPAAAFGTSFPANSSPFGGSTFFCTSSTAAAPSIFGSGFPCSSGTNTNSNNSLPSKFSLNSNPSFSSSSPGTRVSTSTAFGTSAPAFRSSSISNVFSGPAPSFSISSASTSSAPSSFSFANVTASSGLQSSASLKADSTAGTTTASTPAFSAFGVTSSASTTAPTHAFSASPTSYATVASTPAFYAIGVSSSASTTPSTQAFSASGVTSSDDTTTATPACTAFGVTSSDATITTSTQAVTGIGVTLSASTTTASTSPGAVPSFTSPATAAAAATSTGTTSSLLGFQTSAKTSGSLTPEPQSTAATSFVGNRRSDSSTSMKSNRGSPYSSAGPISTMSTSENNNDNNNNQNKNKKQVWIWTENKEVMTSAVERGWSTFIFSSTHRHTATDWSSITLIRPLFIEDNRLFDEEARLVATISEISSPQQLEQLQPVYEHADNLIVDLLDWQVIPAENIVAAFHGTCKTVFAISKSPSEAQVFLEALEQGLGGVVLKTENVEDVVELKGYFDKRNQEGSLLELTKATITGVQMTGMGDRVCVDLCSLMRPGEGLLVGSFARGLFLVHSECLESNYIASRPFRVNAGPVHAYVAVPGGKTCYLSELKTGKEVLVVDQNGIQRTAVVGRVKIETRPLVIVDAMVKETCYSILLQNAETVGLLSPKKGNGAEVIPVTSLKVGDEVLMRLQGGARHTGIEIQEFIVEK